MAWTNEFYDLDPFGQRRGMFGGYPLPPNQDTQNYTLPDNYSGYLSQGALTEEPPKAALSTFTPGPPAPAFPAKAPTKLGPQGRYFAGDGAPRPEPRRTGRHESGNDVSNKISDYVSEAASAVGVDPAYLTRIMTNESGQDPNATSDTGARGLFQFMPQTWKAYIEKYGPIHGLSPDTPPTDPRANALMAAHYTRESTDLYRQRYGRDPSPGDLYMMHFMGPGATKMFDAPPGTTMDKVYPWVFDRTDKRFSPTNLAAMSDRGRPLTVDEFKAKMASIATPAAASASTEPLGGPATAPAITNPGVVGTFPATRSIMPAADARPGDFPAGPRYAAADPTTATDAPSARPGDSDWRQAFQPPQDPALARGERVGQGVFEDVVMAPPDSDWRQAWNSQPALSPQSDSDWRQAWNTPPDNPESAPQKPFVDLSIMTSKIAAATAPEARPGLMSRVRGWFDGMTPQTSSALAAFGTTLMAHAMQPDPFKALAAGGASALKEVKDARSADSKAQLAQLEMLLKVQKEQREQTQADRETRKDSEALASKASDASSHAAAVGSAFDVLKSNWSKLPDQWGGALGTSATRAWTEFWNPDIKNAFAAIKGQDVLKNAAALRPVSNDERKFLSEITPDPMRSSKDVLARYIANARAGAELNRRQAMQPGTIKQDTVDREYAALVDQYYRELMAGDQPALAPKTLPPPPKF